MSQLTNQKKLSRHKLAELADKRLLENHSMGKICYKQCVTLDRACTLAETIIERLEKVPIKLPHVVETIQTASFIVEATIPAREFLDALSKTQIIPELSGADPEETKENEKQ